MPKAATCSGTSTRCYSGRPDAGCVLLDRDVPDMNWLEVLGHIRRHPATAVLPVLMLTARRSSHDEVTALEPAQDPVRRRQDAAPAAGFTSGGILASRSDRT